MTNYEPLFGIPDEMDDWHMRLDLPTPSQFGEYVVVAIEPSPIEQHHLVMVLDETGQPLPDVGVFFGFPGHQTPTGPVPQPDRNHWRGAPAVFRGNYQISGYGEYAKHTVGGGGEDVWVWDIDEDGTLKYPSAIVRNMRWLSGKLNEHTCVKVTFQRRAVGVPVESLPEKIKRLEQSFGLLSEKVEKIVNTLG